MLEECTSTVPARNNGLRKPDPSPAEIREIAAEIRAGWTDYELDVRQTGGRRVRWSVPRVVVPVVQEL